MSVVTPDTASVGVNIASDWGSGFVAGITITAEQALAGWTLTFEFDGDIASIWNAQIVSRVGNTYTVQSMAYNANVGQGGSVNFGFVGRGGRADSITPLSVNDDIFGDDGPAIAVLTGNRDDYVVTQIDATTIELSGPDGIQTFTDIEIFEFADLTQTAEEVIVPRLANLSASGLVVDDASLAPSETATITATVQSDGVIDAGGSTVELVIASQPDAAAILDVIGAVSLDGIATGALETLSFDVSASELAPGTYWVAVRADADDALAEEDEADNLTEWVELTIEEPIADFNLLSADLGDRTDLDLTDGGLIEIDYVVENLSNYSPSYFQFFTYLSTDAVISDDDLRIAGLTGGVGNREIIETSGVGFFPEDFAGGDYYLISVVQWADVVDATPENNTLVQQVTLQPTVDPVNDIAIINVDLLNSSDLDQQGGAQIDISITAEQLGDQSITPTSFSIYLTTDGAVGVYDLPLTTISRSIDTNGPAEILTSVTIDPELEAGDYEIVVIANTSSDVVSTNNVATAAVTLTDSNPVFTEGDDIWISSDTPEQIDLLGGNDLAIAGLVSDQVEGGAGFDTVDFSQLDAAIDADNNSDTLFAGQYIGSDNLSEWTNFEKIIGTDYDDAIALVEGTISEVDAGAGNDLILGSDNDDVIDGGSGDDVIIAFVGDDIITTGAGQDVIAVATLPFLSDNPPQDSHTVTDFDIALDIVLIDRSFGEEFDAATDLVQTDAGAVMNYDDFASVLFLGVGVVDLADAIMIDDTPTTVPTLGG